MEVEEAVLGMVGEETSRVELVVTEWVGRWCGGSDGGVLVDNGRRAWWSIDQQ